jgi:hypothetical protein
LQQVHPFKGFWATEHVDQLITDELNNMKRAIEALNVCCILCAHILSPSSLDVNVQVNFSVSTGYTVAAIESDVATILKSTDGSAAEMALVKQMTEQILKYVTEPQDGVVGDMGKSVRSVADLFRSIL